ncbi:hypothetical protein AB833_26440 [Chromatiales bacterium (ex Bugula neritina AB1)]|nr:hypothetical protein AB833_26440 [Chromatiales bacterium (ex Bugula neritina AB1)]
MINNKGQWAECVEYIESHSCAWSKEPDEGEWGIHRLDTPPHNRLLGPVFARGDACGLVMHEGRKLCEWGDIHRPDMTFSVTKTYLALVAGIAFDQGILSDLDESVYQSLSNSGGDAAAFAATAFSDNHNRQISWRNFLHFTSEWSGACFGVPDQVDHYRIVAMQPQTAVHSKGDLRPLLKPGSYWEYNDVRINQFALALLYLSGRPLPEIFSESIMRPLGASDDWHWHGYDNSYIELSGHTYQSVPGGGHWGGGMVISACDQSRIAQLLIDDGVYEGQQLISRDWLSQMCTPCAIAPWYGYFTWLNTNHAISKAASEGSYFAFGIGGQLVWHDPQLKLVVVMRWIDDTCKEACIEKILACL